MVFRVALDGIGANVADKSVRDAFFSRIYELIQFGEDIYVVSADLGAPSLDGLREKYPERFISVGIAEQSLISISAGLATAGKAVIAYGLNPFPVTRAFDQMRCLVAEQNLPMTICALNAGLCSAECGYTHMPIDDVVLTRALPNIQTINPTTEAMSVMLANDVAHCKTPRFIRFDKSISGNVDSWPSPDFGRGFSVLRRSRRGELVVLTCGCYSREVFDWLKEHGRNLDLSLIDIYATPCDRNALARELEGCETILTVEESVLQGGFGSSILELVSDYGLKSRVCRMGLDIEKGCYDVFVDRGFVREDQGISLESVVKRIRQLLSDEGR